MSNIVVVSHVPIGIGAKRILNPGFVRIMEGYSECWEKVYVVGPSADRQQGVHVSEHADNIILIALKGYEKSLWSRIRFVLYYRYKNASFLNANLNLQAGDIIQIRYPSLYTLFLSYSISTGLCKKVFYIAGDGVEAAKFNRKVILPFARLLNSLERRSVRNCKVATTGPSLAEQYRSVALEVHPYFSTTHTQVARRRPREAVVNILYVGTFERRKRVVDLLHAFTKLSNHNFACKLLGDGVENESLQKLATELDFGDNTLKFMGYIHDKKELRSYYDWADILVLPSLSEGTPRVLPEAMSHGVIPIAIKGVASNDFVITEGLNGMLVSPKSPDDIASTILQIASSKKLYTTLLDGVYDYAVERSLPKELAKLYEFYHS